MSTFNPIKQMPIDNTLNEKDTLIIFGEVFDRGYVNGLIQEAQKKNMKVIHSTVGRRENNQLRALTDQEVQDKNQSPIINIPLETGFDMSASVKGNSPVDQLQGIKLSAWNDVNLDWDQIEQSKNAGREDFKLRVKKWALEVEQHITGDGKVIIAHTMAGGVPRAKIVMPLLNRIFKGFGDRYQSSLEFWNSDIGKLCEQSFSEVTANSFQVLIDETKILSSKYDTYYVAYGYHGTELLIDDKFQWQSYSPYLQGFAKIELENIAIKARQNSIQATVYNCPEILTNSSSIFLGIEVALYPLLKAFQHQSPDHKITKKLWELCEQRLKSEFKLGDLFNRLDNYYEDDFVKSYPKFETWPQHNDPKQMQMMRETSTDIVNMHKDSKNMLTSELSECVFLACGYLMLNEVVQTNDGAKWIGHDIVAESVIEKQLY